MFIGCGKFVTMFLAQYNHLDKIKIDSIVDLNTDQAKKNCIESGLSQIGLADNAILKRDIKKDTIIKLDDVELNLPKEVIEARQYQYDLLY